MQKNLVKATYTGEFFKKKISIGTKFPHTFSKAADRGVKRTKTLGDYEGTQKNNRSFNWYSFFENQEKFLRKNNFQKIFQNFF